MYRKIICLVICLVLSVSILSACGNITDDSPVIKVGETAVTLKEFRFYYNRRIEAFKQQYASRIATTREVDFSVPLYKQAYSGDESKSWADYFSDLTISFFRNYCILAEDARVNGITLSDDDMRIVEKQVEYLKKSISGKGMTDDEFFGSGMTLDDYRETLKRNLLGTNRYYEYLDSVTVSEQECRDYALSKAENYLTLSYSWYVFKAADYNASYHEATHAAEDFAELMDGNVDDFEKLLFSNVLTDSEKESYYEGQYTETYVPFSNLVRDLQAWGYIEKRVPGDYTIVTGTDGIILYVFRSLDFPEIPTYSFRSIFVSSDDNDFEGSLSIKEAHREAEVVKEEFEERGGKEEDFTAMAKLYSDDLSAAVIGGLYENNEFSGLGDGSLEWMTSPERKYGDTEIFDAVNGSYILYYIGEGQPAWLVRAENVLKASVFNDHIEDLAKKYHYTTYKNVSEKVEKEQ